MRSCYSISIKWPPSSSFIFMGFLPKKKSERNKFLLEISKSEKTIVIYESPFRLKKLLMELREYCGGERDSSFQGINKNT